MLCPLWKTEMRIAQVRTVVEGDQSPDTPTVVYTEQELVCRNRQCANFEKVVQTSRAYLVGGENR